MFQYEMDSSRYLPEGSRIGTLSNREATQSIAALERAMAEEKILEGVAMLCDHSLNLHVSVGNFRGIIPHEEVAYQVDGEPIKDIAVISRVGKPICFRVVGVMRTERGEEPQLLLSRRLAQRECTSHF